MNNINKIIDLLSKAKNLIPYNESFASVKYNINKALSEIENIQLKTNKKPIQEKETLASKWNKEIKDSMTFGNKLSISEAKDVLDKIDQLITQEELKNNKDNNDNLETIFN